MSACLWHESPARAQYLWQPSIRLAVFDPDEIGPGSSGTPKVANIAKDAKVLGVGQLGNLRGQRVLFATEFQSTDGKAENDGFVCFAQDSQFDFRPYAACW